MSIFHSLNISSSALTAQRLRMDVVSSNMANADTTRAEFVNGEWQPYRRKLVQMAPQQSSFSSIFQQELKGSNAKVGHGVNVTRIAEDQTPFKQVFNPQHPDANAEGYVQLPNVDPLKEMVDLMSASRSYEANVTVFNASKGMLMKALEIGK
ncbi:flagellar basal body rod protein FlgC [Priestia taiwanensis]|uniref:Flagellar basal-body rod protein FlgC n=1 Tax=Priestia taiwanensis TaxID=1347902 RepID=A0A917APT6_9BACI|nr:flagellar basal body rod protein FlgC [Priestia taiwanensis]MBM7362846.1 flagellar basal-body rod protein FlgC [Priestia taiwanensis]GGE65599.1 flagellar basal-body rod protein FlgC [Priestia taiwanensis]